MSFLILAKKRTLRELIEFEQNPTEPNFLSSMVDDELGNF